MKRKTAATSAAAAANRRPTAINSINLFHITYRPRARFRDSFWHNLFAAIKSMRQPHESARITKLSKFRHQINEKTRILQTERKNPSNLAWTDDTRQ